MTVVNQHPGTAQTQVPSRPAGPRVQQPRLLTSFGGRDVIAILGALAAALATTALLWLQLSPFTGLFGYVAVTWCLFVMIYATLVGFDDDKPAVRDRVSAVIVHSLAVAVGLALVDVVIYTLVRGWDALVHTNFYTQDLHATGPLDPLTKGGVLHAVVGTLIEVSIALGIAVPLGLLAAVFLHEVPGPFS